MKRFSLLKLGALTATVACLLPLATLADDYDKKGIVKLSQPTEVPGIVLQPGTYVIKLLNSQSDRHIAEIMNEKMDHLYALTFTAAAFRVERTGKPVLTFYEGKNSQPQAIKRWFWPGELDGIEFLYPKTQAAKIAAATHQKVAEGGLPTVAESGQSLIPDSAKAVTLQSEDERKPAAAPFTANAAEPAAAPAPAPAAAPAPDVIAQTTPAPVVIAQNKPPAPATRSDEASPTAVSPNTSPSDEALPQTASNLPLIGAIGFVSLALAVLISIRRYRLS
jgi:hypothetical protein